MTRRRGRSNQRILNFEQCEERALLAPIFVLNGDGFGAVGPNTLTARAAQVLQRAGHQAIQISTPKIATTAAFYGLVKSMEALSHGRSIGIVGFSAGGSLAIRLSGVKTLHVTAALDYYGPPSLRDYLNYHNRDRFAAYVLGRGRVAPAAINLLSGPSDTSAYVVSVFGLYDRNVVASVSTSSLQHDFPAAHVYYYAGAHGVSINASPQALQDFLAHV
jgi:dienelactone hydrolase